MTHTWLCLQLEVSEALVLELLICLLRDRVLDHLIGFTVVHKDGHFLLIVQILYGLPVNLKGIHAAKAYKSTERFLVCKHCRYGESTPLGETTDPNLRYIPDFLYLLINDLRYDVYTLHQLSFGIFAEQII